MPGAPIAESLGDFLDVRNRIVCRSSAEADIPAGYAELAGFKLIIRVLDEKLLAAADRTPHRLFPQQVFPPSAAESIN